VKSHYEVLGVKRDAKPEQIKHAYRRLAMKHHPDRNGDGHDPKAMTAIQIAYDVLSDPERRQRYDETGDSNPQQSLDAEATQELARAFQQVIQMVPPGGDPLPLMRDGMANALTEIDQTLQFLATIPKRRGVIRLRTEGGLNLYEGVLDTIERDAEKTKRDLEGRRKLILRAREMLSEYEATQRHIVFGPSSYTFSEFVR
jgi:curved DNA-binding protein CbpA